MTMQEFKVFCREYFNVAASVETSFDRHRLQDEWAAHLGPDWAFLFNMVARWEFDLQYWLDNYNSNT